MTTWPEFYFDSEFESASEIPNMANQQMKLAEAYSMTARAIHTHRTRFFTLKPQDQRSRLITTAKELAKLVFDKNRAHHKLVRASKHKFSPENKSLIETQNCKVSHSCPPLQLPFQLLWPPDPVPQPSTHPLNVGFHSQSKPPAAKRQPLNTGQPSVDHPPDQSKPPGDGGRDQPAEGQPQIVVKKQPQMLKSQTQNVVQNQPLKTGMKSQSQKQPRTVARKQPPASRSQPTDDRVDQPPVVEPPKDASHPQTLKKQPQNVAKKQLPDAYQRQNQPLTDQPAIKMQPPDQLRDQPRGQPQVVSQPPAQHPVAQPPDLPPEPDPISSLSKEDWGKG